MTATLPTKKRSPFHCRKCSFKTTGPHKMHLHYVKNPTHNPKAGMPSAQPGYKRTRRSSVSSRLNRVQFCPCCGFNLGALLGVS